MNKITPEQEVQHANYMEIAKIFEDNAEHPIQLLYTRLIKEALDVHNFTISHLPISDSIEKKMQKIENISGRIKELELLRDMPNSYITYKKESEKELKKEDKDD